MLNRMVFVNPAAKIMFSWSRNLQRLQSDYNILGYWATVADVSKFLTHSILNVSMNCVWCDLV